jgi:hypothetical protein
MNIMPIFIFALCSSFCLLAQPIGEHSKDPRKIPPLNREAPKRVCSEGESRNEYFFESKANDRYVWSIRDRNWVPMPTSLFGFTFGGGLINGPRVLRPGVTQEYTLACVSHYKGTPKYLWIKEPAVVFPYKLGEIYSDDEVEIEWEIRTSPGVRVVAQPEFPSKLRYWEPMVAPFKIEVSGDSIQRVEIYANGYRDGKMIGFSWIPLIINPEGCSEAEEQREKKALQDLKHDFATKEHMDWHQAPWSDGKIKNMKQEFESRHFFTKRYRTEGLRSGEFLTDTEDLDKM